MCESHSITQVNRNPVKLGPSLAGKRLAESVGLPASLPQLPEEEV
jgi:hypothetical protein